MSDRKVIPITGKHTSMHSMVAECMADPESVRGYIIYFTEDGNMRIGHFGTTRADTCMAATYLNMKAIDAMREEDDE